MTGPPPKSERGEGAGTDLPAVIAEVSASSAAAIATAMGNEGDLVATRLDRGCRCFGAWIDEEVAGYGWLSTKAEWIGELQLEISPPDGEAYVWNCVTLPRHRLKGVFRTLLQSIAARSREEGVRRLWLGSMHDPAEKAVISAGFFPAVHFEVTSQGLRRTLIARAAPGTDGALAAVALHIVAVHLGAQTHRVTRRRH